jgi:hypothetical protein
MQPDTEKTGNDRVRIVVQKLSVPPALSAG